jgi:cysteinyl-tRNA synthetase
MYACGPTVYNYAHIGNFRAYLFSDLLRKWLEHEGYAVKLVMNLTDVDDKTIKGSREYGKSLKDFTSFYEKAFFEDLDSLGIKRASVYPKATKHVPEMIGIIEKLLERGMAYKGEDGSVYYKISSFKNYGKLSHLDLKELKVGASGRLTADEYEKESVSDFALWKAWTPEDGDVFWQAPFGKGRPGWHIECSAMSMKYLGESFDIHAGGVDLKFPHHENEIAQSEGATGKKFVKYWLHNEHLLVDGRKMAKRFKNFYTLRDVLAKGYSPKAVRFLLLSTHYRSQLNFTFEALDNAENTVEKLDTFAFNVLHLSNSEKGFSRRSALNELLFETKRKFASAMNDDLNVAEALSVFFAFVKEFNEALNANKLSLTVGVNALQFLREFNDIFGIIDLHKYELNFTNSEADEIKKLVDSREKARKEKDFKKADELRNLLKKKGIVLEDTPKGVVWKKMV